MDSTYDVSNVSLEHIVRGDLDMSHDQYLTNTCLMSCGIKFDDLYHAITYTIVRDAKA